MSNDNWWDDLYGTDTGQDTNRDTTTRDKTRRDKTRHNKPRETPRHVGRTVTLKRRPEGPKPLDDLTAETPRTSPRRPADTSNARASKRRTTGQRAKTTGDTTDKSDATDDTTPRDTTTDADDTTPDTKEHKRSPGKRVGDWLAKAQDGATDLADEVASTAKEAPDETEEAARQERLARAIEGLSDFLQPVEPTRWWTPPWLGTVATICIFNITAAAAGHYTAALLGYPDLAPSVLVHDYVNYFAVDDGDWLTPLIMSLFPPLICALLFDRRARHWGSTILRWLVRIPLAATTAGALAATWTTIVQLTTGASS